MILQQAGSKGDTDASLLWKTWVQLFVAQEGEKCCSAQSSARQQDPPEVHAHQAQPAVQCMPVVTASAS